MNKYVETIVAPATALERSAIGMVRMSGPRAVEILVSCAKNKERLKLHDRVATLVELFSESDGRLIDTVVATFFKAPRSYTGEDVVEVGCHGNPVIMKSIIERFIAAGARLARPGEFTRRAFLNGKMSLLEAESIEYLIQAESLEDIQKVRETDRLQRRINNERDRILKLLSHLEASIDFPEDGVDELDREYLIRETESIRDRMEELLKLSRRTRRKIRVTLVGEPNVGKSSLFNRLLEFDRAIVTDVAGTTRDPLSEEFILDGHTVELVDTAGFQDTEDELVRLAVERSRIWKNESDILIEVHDSKTVYRSYITGMEGKKAVFSNDEATGHEVRVKDEKRSITVLNKVDLLTEEERKELEKYVLPGGNTILASAKGGQGISELKRKLAVEVASLKKNEAEEIFLSMRQRSEIEETKKYLDEAIESLKEGMPEDAITVDLRGALSSIGRMDGTMLSEEILDRIFRDFCIGK